MNRFRRRVGVQRIEKYEACVQVVARTNLDRLFGGIAVSYQHDVILESANLERSPTDLFNDSGVSLSADCDDVANLKRPVSLQRDSGEEVSERVLERKSEDHTEDSRSRKERTEVDSWKQKSESNQKQNRKRDDGEDVSDQRGRVDPFESKRESEEECIESTNKKVTDYSDEKQLNDIDDRVGRRRRACAHSFVEEYSYFRTERPEQVCRQQCDCRRDQEKNDFISEPGASHNALLHQKQLIDEQKCVQSSSFSLCDGNSGLKAEL